MLVVGLRKEIDMGVFVQPQRLQIDILPNVVYFVADRYGVEGGLGVHIFQNVGKLDKGRFGLVRFGEDQSVERIQGIEEKMRVNLAAEKIQFRLFQGKFCGQQEGGTANAKKAIKRKVRDLSKYKVSHLRLRSLKI